MWFWGLKNYFVISYCTQINFEPQIFLMLPGCASNILCQWSAMLFFTLPIIVKLYSFLIKTTLQVVYVVSWNIRIFYWVFLFCFLIYFFVYFTFFFLNPVGFDRKNLFCISLHKWYVSLIFLSFFIPWKYYVSKYKQKLRL